MGNRGFEPLSGTRHLALTTKLTSLAYATFTITKDESHTLSIYIIVRLPTPHPPEFRKSLVVHN